MNCTTYAAMEYRHESARGRYMVRPRDPETMQPYAADDGQWFDYDGDEIYGDFSVSYDEQSGTVVATDLLAHEPGMAQWRHGGPGGSNPPGGVDELHYLHGNLIGTTERMTDDPNHGGGGPDPAIAHRAVYTAFGEPVWSGGVGVPPASTRYGYAGAWGYQSGSWNAAPGACDTGMPSLSCDPVAELGWLHVGARYYDPSSGRFVQRDPIGIRGGLNVYGTLKYGGAASGALASTCSTPSGAAGSSSRKTLRIGSGCAVGSTPDVSTSFSLSMYSRMLLSCTPNRATSSSLSLSRARWAM